MPSIFRSLEKEAGQGGFDTIVTAAVASFAAHRNPSERQAHEFGRLVAPAWDKIDTKTKRALAAALSQSPRVPRTIVEKLLAAPIDTAAPFLVASPCLTADDIEVLARRSSPKLQRILGRRRKSGEATDRPSAEAAAPAAVPAPTMSPSGATKKAAAKAVVAIKNNAPRPHTAEPANVSEARAVLLRLAEPGKHLAKPAASAPTTVVGIVEMARAGCTNLAYDGLALMLKVPDSRMREMFDDPTGEILAAALKAINTGPADALTIIMLLKPRVGRDIAAFNAMKFAYRDLDVDECRGRFGLSSAPPARNPVLHQRQYADLEPRIEASAPRPVFGRRRVLPSRTAQIGAKR
ncbi:hypothetical protein [Aurantimonas marina]|uniref:hypothetical protein n=1 Tax=Aurantimonas marina TaxID=2780508 RepID=UPI0019D1BB06|nr:hypothetical protein [Aurantimonas marina]